MEDDNTHDRSTHPKDKSDCVTSVNKESELCNPLTANKEIKEQFNLKDSAYDEREATMMDLSYVKKDFLEEESFILNTEKDSMTVQTTKKDLKSSTSMEGIAGPLKTGRPVEKTLTEIKKKQPLSSINVQHSLDKTTLKTQSSVISNSSRGIGKTIPDRFVENEVLTIEKEDVRHSGMSKSNKLINCIIQLLTITLYRYEKMWYK